MQALKILLVDDNEDDYFMIHNLLASGIDTKRYSLSWCATYSEAINAMLKDRYALYLVDYKFANYSGIRLLSEAVKSNCTKPIIMVTSKGEENINEEALKVGAADYITKDQVNTEILERSVRYATGQFEMLEKLKRNEHTFRVLFERSKDAIIISTPSGQILDANRSALNFFGVNYADMGDINTAFFYRHPSERQSFVKALQRDGAVNEILLELLTLNGDVRTCCVSSFIEIPQHGQTELFYTFLKEVKESHPQIRHSGTSTSSHVLRDQFSRSVRAVRTSLSKINQAIETELDPDAYARDTSLFDAIRMNASFADQALQTLEEECAD